jgi:hypothetical protein
VRANAMLLLDYVRHTVLLLLLYHCYRPSCPIVILALFRLAVPAAPKHRCRPFGLLAVPSLIGRGTGPPGLTCNRFIHE